MRCLNKTVKYVRPIVSNEYFDIVWVSSSKFKILRDLKMFSIINLQKVAPYTYTTKIIGDLK